MELLHANEMIMAENLRLHNIELERECDSLKQLIKTRPELSEEVLQAVRERIEVVNSMIASKIIDPAESYSQWLDQLTDDRQKFLDSTRLALKVSHPQFIDYLEEHGLTEQEINYVCLYALGLRGKEAGEYFQLKRHYHLSSDVRRKLGIHAGGTNLTLYIRKLLKDLSK